LANARYMAEKLRSHGWHYITVDIQWYEPLAQRLDYRAGAKLEMDEYGRLLPAINRFPSAAGGRGFKPLADAIHALGLKFGLHLLRGIPRQAVAQNTPILNSIYHAADIANPADVCAWNGDMYGVDMSKPGAQDYYNSVFQLFASWGVDFIKVDDLSRPYHKDEIDAIRRAIDSAGRPIVFSTSPGATPVAEGPHIESHANMWRISDDFWDSWRLLKEQFVRLDAWTPFRGPGHFPDADMLPLGNVRAFERNGWTRFTHDEQITLISLWCIARSPLILGGNLPKNDDFTLSLLTNDEVLAVDQHSSNNQQIFRRDGFVAWAADAEDDHGKYVALINARDPQPGDSGGGLPVAFDLNSIGFSAACHLRDLWTHRELGDFQGSFRPIIPFHGAGLYRISP